MKKYIILGTNESFIIVLHAAPNATGSFQWYLSGNENDDKKSLLGGQEYECIVITSEQISNLYNGQWIFCECNVEGAAFTTEKTFLTDDFVEIISNNQFNDVSFFNDVGNIRNDIKYCAYNLRRQ